MPIETIKLSESKYKKYLRGFPNTSWTLCLGAGICIGILPNWSDLTFNIIKSTFGNEMTREEFDKFHKDTGFSLDSLMQSCYNKLISQGKSIEEFNNLLEKNLYKELLEKAEKKILKIN